MMVGRVSGHSIGCSNLGGHGAQRPCLLSVTFQGKVAEEKKQTVHFHFCFVPFLFFVLFAERGSFTNFVPG